LAELLESLSLTLCREGGEANRMICSGRSDCFGSLACAKEFQVRFRFGGISSRFLDLVSGGVRRMARSAPVDRAVLGLQLFSSRKRLRFRF
jgi:hypothetical protein